jgi:hypothetical protein
MANVKTLGLFYSKYEVPYMKINRHMTCQTMRFDIRSSFCATVQPYNGQF